MPRTPALLRGSWVQTALAIPRSFSRRLCPVVPTRNVGHYRAVPAFLGVMVARLGRAGYSTKVGVPRMRCRLRPWMLVTLTGTGIAGESTALLVRLPVTGEAPRSGG